MDENNTDSIRTRNLHIFETFGLHLAYDIDNVKIFRITPLAADILRISPGKTPRQVETSLDHRYPREQIGKTLGALIKVGLVGPAVTAADSPGIGNNVGSDGTGRSTFDAKNKSVRGLNKLVLALTDRCNLHCKYCLSTLEPDEHGKGMTLETGRKAVDFLLAHMKQQTGANIVFYGGEPLLKFKTLESIFNYAREQAQRAGKTFTYTVITNGTLLTPAIMDFLTANGFTIGLSLDGDQPIHDASRVYKDGTGSYEQVIENYRQLLKRGADVTPQAVLSSQNPDILDVITSFQREGVVNYKLIPCMLPDGEAELLTDGHHDYGHQFERMVRAVLAESEPGGLPIDMFQMMNNIDGAHKSRFSCTACSSQLAVSTVGELYPCDNFLYTPQYRIGDLDNGIQRDLSGDFKTIGIDSIAQCRTCWARFLCGGPCPYYSQRKHGRIDQPVESFCRHKRETAQTTLAAYTLCKCKDKDFIKKWVQLRFAPNALLNGASNAASNGVSYASSKSEKE